MATPVAGPPTTPDGRYVVVRGRLWRKSDPALAPDARQALIDELMDARRAVHTALRSGDDAALHRARDRVQAAKVGLGERGAVWWADGTPDLNGTFPFRTSIPPRRRPGPSCATPIGRDGPRSRRPLQLGPGLRRGGTCSKGIGTDLNRHMARNTGYAEWYARLEDDR